MLEQNKGPTTMTRSGPPPKTIGFAVFSPTTQLPLLTYPNDPHRQDEEEHKSAPEP